MIVSDSNLTPGHKNDMFCLLKLKTYNLSFYHYNLIWSTLQTFFPLKEAVQIEELVAALSDSEKVNVKSLFGTDREGNISEFLNKLYVQFYDG